MCILLFGWNIQYISITSISIIYHQRPIFPCWFCLGDLTIDVSRVFKPPTIILLSLSSFMSLSICCMYLGDLMVGALAGLIPLLLCHTFVLCCCLCFKVYFVPGLLLLLPLWGGEMAEKVGTYIWWLAMSFPGLQS